MSDNIKVVVKVRPLIAREIEEKQQHQWRVNNNTLFQIDSNGRDSGPIFTFDKVYCENTKTSDVYNDVAKPIVEAAVTGFNGTIFAYGQTSSGKTYTMTGTDEYPGIIPLAVMNLFEIIKNVPGRDFVVSVSYIEIYNETIRDLLDLKNKVIVKQTYTNVCKVCATDRVTASPEEVLEAMKEGNANRQTAYTNMNESSSRSHSIFQINIESREHIEEGEQVGCVNVSQLNLVDLAGSERAGQTGATGLRFKEGTAINKSLTSLALVIKQLSEDPNKFINYRDSKLTRILQNSLGGNAKTSIICAITPAALEETNSTLQFATRAKIIENKPEVNAVATDATMIQKLTKELSSLQSQLESKKNLEVILETKKNVEQDLQKQIANLQRFILNFGQRPNVELMGARKKIQPARRKTISTLHPIEADVPKVQKYNTPCLKYNPCLVQNEFIPIQNPSKSVGLSSLPEEPPRLITPPPKDKKVNFSDDVIELDSDDDDCLSVKICSPYHKCRGASKTPPCILRKNAEQAAKEFKDLLELTDREKMYSPSMVELIKQIDESTAKKSELQDEIEALMEISKKKDLEIELLKSKINNTEENIKSISSVMVELENQRKEFKSKLTDWEVSYETLKNKAKLREDELISLLEEQRISQAVVGKMPFNTKDNEIIHFMSRDISSVNRDNKSSIISPDPNEHSEPTSIVVKDMDETLASKNQVISQLETDIKAHKQQIQRLEKSNYDLLSQVDSYKDKLQYISKENVLLQSTVKELNITIKSQKENMELTQNDTNSYKSIIQELQIKLTDKEMLLDNDAVLESMLTNEDKTIANNENIKNIIHSLKLALEGSRKEIDLLKLKLQNNNETEDKDPIRLQVKILNDEISKFTRQANENMVTINTLLREKNDLALIEQELIQKISKIKQKSDENEVICKNQTLLIEELKKDNEKLCKNEKNHEGLAKQIQDAKDKIVALEVDVKDKNNQLDTLNMKNEEFQDCLAKAQLAVNKLQGVLTMLTGNVQETPDILDSFVVVYKTLNDNLDILENIVVETVAQKNEVKNNYIKLQNEISVLELKHTSKLSEVTEKTVNLNKYITKLTSHIKQLIQNNNHQNNQIKILKQSLNDKNNDLKNLETQIKDMRDEHYEKDLVICSLKENEVVLFEKIRKLEIEANTLNCALKSQEDKYTFDIEQSIELKDKLQQKCIELTQAEHTLQENQEIHDQLVESIVGKLIDVIDNIKENSSSFKTISMFEQTHIQDHRNILLILDAIVDHIVLQSPMENENNELKRKVEEIRRYNKSLECNLKQSSELLRQIQEELKTKSTEIGDMEQKVKEWKQQFIDLDMSMKEQMLFLQSENEKLKNQSLKQTMQLDLMPAEKNAESSRNAYIGLSHECENKRLEKALPSLVSICSNRIIEILDQKQNDNMTSKRISSANACRECEQLALELRYAREDNIRLINILEQLEIVNKDLSIEHSEINEEVRLLLELTQELQKKIVSHRTNLSILTATTYTENKSLNSQVKGLQHHHSRFHNVCQRDIPEFKKQLNELMIILNEHSSFCDSNKRFSLPILLDNTTTSGEIRNESTFDGELLMLDTNVSLMTADNTLVGYNQTCLDSTQTVLNETDFQTVDLLTEPNMLRNQMDVLKKDNETMSAKLEMLVKENMKLKEEVTKYILVNASAVKDAQSSPIKISGMIDDVKDEKYEIILKELKLLTEQLSVVTTQKKDLETKYNDLVLEMPSTDALVSKMKAMEGELKNKVNEISIISDILKSNRKEAKALQEENDSLSTQVMEHISEADDLNKEVEQLKEQNLKLLAQCKALELDNQSKVLSCSMTNDILISKPNNENNAKLNRSLSDSDTTTRHNKICTLQSEIHAGREDCKVLTEDVATIKHHLDHSNMSMDLDESINFELASDSLPGSPQSKKCNMPDIQEERTSDVYMADKNDCYHYYLEKTGIEKDNLTCNLKMIEVMKLLHENLISKHGNEVENLVNQLNDHQELYTSLQTQISVMKEEHDQIKNDLEKKDHSFNIITNVVTQLRENVRLIKPIDTTLPDLEECTKVLDELKDKFFDILDKNFNLSSVHIFEQITGHINKLLEDYSCVSDTLTKTKYNLCEKEKECNIRKSENDKIHDINNAVTLDIIKIEEFNKNIIEQTYRKLVELNMISPDIVTITEPVNIHILIRLLEHFINEYQKEKAKGDNSLEINGYKAALAEKEKILNELHLQNVLLQSTNSNNARELSLKDDEINNLKTSVNELNNTMTINEKETAKNQILIQTLSEEIRNLKDNITNKEKMLVALNDNCAKVNELMSTVKNLQDDNIKLKSVNEMLTTETNLYASELEKSSATIKQNNIDIDKMTSDILALRESLKETTAGMEKLKQEVQTLSKEIVEVKQELEIKSRDCSRLEINIKTHEKTAEVQSRMIMRLQKQNEEVDYKRSNDLTEKYAALQAEFETSRNTIKTLNEELEHLRTAKQSLENRLAEAEDDRRSRLSIDAITDSSKRRRQSLHDSKRMFEEMEEHKSFIVDDDSGRSTPFGHVKGRDSLLSRTDHSDKDDEHTSRPSSVLARAARRRRQSSHDLHRSVTPNAPSPSDLSNYVIDELQQLKADTSRNRLHSDNEITQLRAQLASCEQELEDLKDKYRELDEECEICAEYLRERDEQCIRLKKEKAALENQVMELKTKVDHPSNPTFKFRTAAVAHVSVNTDEDWTNLHAVVVDRMSYDAEVEKNKKLAKTIEELRFSKLELRNTIAKMQKALERYSAKDSSRDLEQTKKQLKASNDELQQLRTRYKELDEECETCANYLKEREEQCRKLKEVNAALEAKVEKLQEKSQAIEHTKSVRKKRQTIYDMNRPETSADQTDASTETIDGILSSQMDGDDTQRVEECTRDLSNLKKMVGRLTQQKMHLEMQLRAAQVTNPMFVATGSAIVQNQQITDVMKENQKLKKMNAKLITICKKRGKSANRENEDPSEQGYEKEMP